MTRRGWLGRIFAAAVVVAASPTALVAPKVWKSTKDWYNGVLTKQQSERFIQLMLLESVMAGKAIETPMSSDAVRDWMERERPGAIEGKRYDIVVVDDPYGVSDMIRCKLCGRDVEACLFERHMKEYHPNGAKSEWWTKDLGVDEV